MKIQVPEKVNEILKSLMAAGFEAYAVGGCVRDALLGREAADWDITTSARPEQVKALFPRTIDTGIQHGTVTVMLGKEGFEVTTYRIDGEYEDSRHPKEVVFTASLIEDLKRRDFTINAMAYNEEAGLVDAFGGVDDLKRGVIRCVGEPNERFTEDALRILRAVRFAAQLGFSIDPATREAISRFAGKLVHVSAERIQVELVKLLVSDHPDMWRTVYETGISRVILPEFDPTMKTEQHNLHHIYTVGEHTLKALTEVPSDKVLRLTMLFHDLGKPSMRTEDANGVHHFKGHPAKSELMAKNIMKRLKFDNDTMKKVARLVACHDIRLEPEKRAVRRGIYKIGADIFPQYLLVRRADILAQNPAQWQEKLAKLSRVSALYEEILRDQECLSLKDLAVTGNDLIALGVPRGQQIGRVLDKLLQLVLEQPERNTKEYLLEAARQECGLRI